MVLMVILLHFDKETGGVEGHAEWVVLIQIDTYNIAFPGDSVTTVGTPEVVLCATRVIIKCIVTTVFLILAPGNAADSCHLMDVALFHQHEYIDSECCH